MSSIRELDKSDKSSWLVLWRGYLEFYETDIPIEQIPFQKLDRRCRSMDRQRFRPQRTDRIENKGDGIDVVKVGVRNKNVVDKRQFRQREFTDAGSRVNQNILINQ